MSDLVVLRARGERAPSGPRQHFERVAPEEVKAEHPRLYKAATGMWRAASRDLGLPIRSLRWGRPIGSDEQARASFATEPPAKGAATDRAVMLATDLEPEEGARIAAHEARHLAQPAGVRDHYHRAERDAQEYADEAMRRLWPRVQGRERLTPHVAVRPDR